MRFTPSNTYNTIAKAAAYDLEWHLYYRVTTSLSGSLTANDFTDVSDYIESAPFVSSKVEYNSGNFSADSVSLKLLDIEYWKTNVFTDAIMDDDDQFIEMKVTVNVKLGSLTSETIIPFYGFVNKESIQYEELADTVEIDVYTPEVLADKIPAYTLNTQYTKNITSGSVMILPRIPGVYVKDANTGGLPLKVGVHTIGYNADTMVLQLDSGREVEVTGSGFLTLGDNSYEDYSIYGDNQQVQVYIEYEDLVQALDTTLEDEIIVTTEGDTLPRQPYYSFNLNEMIGKVYEAMGVTYTATDTLEVASYDGSLRPSFIAVPPGDVPGNIATAFGTDNTNYLYFGIGNKIYETPISSSTTFRLIASSSDSTGDSIKKIMYNSGTGNFWIYYVTGSDHQVRKMTRTLSGSVYNYTMFGPPDWYTWLNYNKNLDVRTMEPYHINYSGSAYKNGVLFYANNYGMYYVDEDSYSGSFIATSSTFMFPSAQNLIFSGAYACLGGLSYNGVVYNQAMHKSAHISTAGTWTVDATQKFVYRMAGTQVVYSPYNNYFHYFDTGSLGEPENTGRLIRVSSSGAPGTEIIMDNISGSFTPATTFYDTNRNTVAIALNRVDKPEDGLLITVGPTYTINYYEIPSLTGQSLLNFPNVWYLVNQTGIFYEMVSNPAMSISPGFKYVDLSLRALLNKLLTAFNLVGTINSNKVAKIFRRTDTAGNIVTTGQTALLTADDVTSLTINYENYKSAKIVKLNTENKETSYDGTNFDVGYFTNTRKVEVNSNVIPDYLYKDMAKHFFGFFNKDLSTVKLTVITPMFQYEIFDAVNIQLSGTKTNLTATGIIYSISHNGNGATTLEVLV